MKNGCSKVIIENFSEPCLLFLLLQKPSYGYELKQNLEERCGCHTDIGNLYRALGKLQKKGYVSRSKSDSDLGPSRQTYKLTKAGEKLLKDWMEALTATNNTINQLIDNYKKHYENN